MQSCKFTVMAQLHEENNRGLIDYTDSSRSDYGKALRETFYAKSSAVVSISHSIKPIFKMNMELLVGLPILSFLMPKDALTL